MFLEPKHSVNETIRVMSGFVESMTVIMNVATRCDPATL